MPKIQVRRGTSQEIGSIIPDVGEPYYVTDTKSFGIGNGINTTGKGSFDGQWEKKIVVLANNVPAPTTTDLPYDLSSYLPNDNYKYEILLWGRVQTGTTSGNRAVLSLASDVLSDYRVVEAQTRAAASVIASSTAIIPVGTGREINVEAVAANTGTYSILLTGYRRIGTNA